MIPPPDFSLTDWLPRRLRPVRSTSPISRPDWPHSESIGDFSYSKLRDFRMFAGEPFRPFGVGVADPATCNLKVYQDYLAYCFIRRNVPPGSRILDVGGGDSRILRYFCREYECWNVDKCEGLGNGPTKFSSKYFRTVYDYVGDFSTDLPDAYFDLVFSISSLEHTSEDPLKRKNILEDINRLLKPGADSFHQLDVVARPDGQTWVNGLIPYLYQNAPLLTRAPNPEEIMADPDTYYMSEPAFDKYWRPAVNAPYAVYGRPLSVALYWRRAA